MSMALARPRPLPKGLTEEDLSEMTVNDGAWREHLTHYCRHCGAPAYLNPYTNSIWGCKECGYTTTAVFVFFAKLNETA
jgi:hypothetical protein